MRRQSKLDDQIQTALNPIINKKMSQHSIPELGQELNDAIDEFQSKANERMKQTEMDHLVAYEGHMNHVYKELQRFKHRTSD